MSPPETEAAWMVMELMMPLILNILPDLCRLGEDMPQLISVCIQRYMRECVVLRSSSRGSVLDQHVPASLQQGEVGGVSGGAAGGVPQATVNVLSNVKKLIKSLLLLNPEAYLWLSPEVQTAWRLIEHEPSVREIDASWLYCRES